jgi:hypothetical protein
MSHVHVHLHYHHDQEREAQRAWMRQMRSHERDWRASAHQRADQIRALCTLHQGEVPRALWESVLEEPAPTDHDALPAWEARVAFANRVLDRDASVYLDALRVCRCLADIRRHVGDGGIALEIAPESITVTLDAPSSSAMHLPSGIVVAMKELAHGDEHRIYQDYVCGLALRAARDVLAVLPVDDVVVDVMLSFRAPDSEPVTTRALSVVCPRAMMDTIDWSSGDASDTLELLMHEMAFSPSAGFRSVPRVSR